MNRKGQVLVAFIIILPLLFMIMALVIDLGNLYIEKRSVENNIKDVLEYALNNLDDARLEIKIRNQLNINIENINNLIISINDEVIEIKLEKNKKGIFNSIINDHYQISSHYKGYKNNEQIVIQKEGN